jgi:hypothetical protein
MKKQIMSLTIPHNGAWKIITDDSEVFNPFKVYYVWNELTDYGIRKRMKLITKYGDLASCLHCITQQLTGYEWRMTDRKVERLFTIPTQKGE